MSIVHIEDPRKRKEADEEIESLAKTIQPITLAEAELFRRRGSSKIFYLTKRMIQKMEDDKLDAIKAELPRSTSVYCSQYKRIFPEFMFFSRKTQTKTVYIIVRRKTPEVKIDE